MEEKIIPLLKKCSTRDDIGSLFNTYDIKDYDKRIKIIRKCTGEINEYFSSDDSNYSEEDYEYKIITFLDGAWKLFNEER